MTKLRVSGLRDRAEIVMAHDLLDEVLNNPEINKLIEWDADTKSELIGIKRTLCWILGHDEGRWFADNIAKLQKTLKVMGFDLKRTQ